MADRERVDPATSAAQALLGCIAAFRDLLTDDAYGALLPHLQVLADALPQNVAVPGPRAPESVGEPHPMDREAG